jgi:hypothetical protein
VSRTKYTIPAIPTVYKDIEFRSRLEAKWAAFFDAAGWRWEYEPFDLNGWIPDFVLNPGIKSVLVEVKPFQAFEDWGEVITQVTRATVGTQCHDSNILLLGASLLEVPVIKWPSIGWYGHYDAACQRLDFGQAILHMRNRQFGFFHFFMRDQDVITAETVDVQSVVQMKRAEYLWAKATNMVKWKPRRSMRG